MKKWLAILLSAMLILACAAAMAEEESESGSFWEMDADQRVMTVRLAANATTGYEWTYEISDGDLLDLVAAEYLEGEFAQDAVGSGGMWAASFANVNNPGAVGEVTLTFNYSRPWELEEEPVETRSITLWIVEDGTMQVLEAE